MLRSRTDLEDWVVKGAIALVKYLGTGRLLPPPVFTQERTRCVLG